MHLLLFRGVNLKIILSNRSSDPIYEQIKSQVKAAILSGELSEGDLLPSVRQLARDLRISVITTTRAYSDLEQEGFVTNVQGKGCYVLPQNKDLLRERTLCSIEEGLLAAITAAKTARIRKDELIRILDLLCEEENYD